MRRSIAALRQSGIGLRALRIVARCRGLCNDRDVGRDRDDIWLWPLWPVTLVVGAVILAIVALRAMALISDGVALALIVAIPGVWWFVASQIGPWLRAAIKARQAQTAPDHHV